jgi:hypothetical protein
MRFERYLHRDDDLKERFLDLIAGGMSEDEALARMAGLRGAPTKATVRGWARTDREFAEALRAARTEPPGEPHIWAGTPADRGEIPPPSASEYEIEQAGFRRWGR